MDKNVRGEEMGLKGVFSSFEIFAISRDLNYAEYCEERARLSPDTSTVTEAGYAKLVEFFNLEYADAGVSIVGRGCVPATEEEIALAREQYAFNSDDIEVDDGASASSDPDPETGNVWVQAWVYVRKDK